MKQLVVSDSIVFKLFVLLVISISSTNSVAQWNNSTDFNTIVYDGGVYGSKIVNGVNFYYVSSYQIIPGSRIPYLHKINFDGYMEWPETGLLINNSDQPSNYTRYDIKVDASNNAIVAYRNESPSQQEQYVTTYKISPEGEFLWGENGKRFDISGAMEISPLLCINQDSSITMMTNLFFDNPNHPGSQIALMRYSSAGDELWGTDVIIGFEIYSAIHIGIVPDGENGCYVIYIKLYNGENEIFARRINEEGISIWPQDIQISAGSLGAITNASIKRGDKGEVFVAWKSYIGSPFTSKVFVMGVNPDGSKTWNGDPIGMFEDETDCQMSEHILGQDSEENLLVVWSECYESGSTSIDLLGQKISSSGELLWEPGGKRLILDGQFTSVASQIHNDTIFLCYKDAIFHLDLYQAVNLIAITSNGNAAWTNPTVLNSEMTSKPGLYMSQIINGQGVVCFESHEMSGNSKGQVKIQNFWTDGTIGPRNTSFMVLEKNVEKVNIWFNDQLKAIEIAGHTMLKSYSVIDLYGRVVMSCKLHYSIATKLTIPCHDLSSGVYIVRITDGIGFSTKKLFVQ